MERESYTKAFVLRKLHALSGVVPLGVFLVEYLWSCARVLRSDRAFATDGQSLLLPVIEIVVVLLPLAFHVLYSSQKLSETRVRRVSGGVALAFVGFHLWDLRGKNLVRGLAGDAFYDALTARLSSTTAGLPLWALVYLVGIAATVFHFASGVSEFPRIWNDHARNCARNCARHARTGPRELVSGRARCGALLHGRQHRPLVCDRLALRASS